MNTTRPLSLSLSYVRERITPYARMLRDRRSVVAISAASFVVGALSIIAVFAVARLAEEAGLLLALAASSASSVMHEIGHEIDVSLYYVRCVLKLNMNVRPLSIIATTISAVFCGRQLAQRTMTAVREIEKSRERIYAIVADKFSTCVKCAHKTNCTFHSYEHLKAAAERALADTGIDLYAIQMQAMHHATRSHRRLLLPKWEQVCEVFHAPPEAPTIDVEPAIVKPTAVDPVAA